MEEAIIEGTRFSGADWATELKEIIIVGMGGIGSHLALNLARIGHTLYLIDGDRVDTTNITGGQLYRTKDNGRYKAEAVKEICREFGCNRGITPITSMYDNNTGTTPIMATGLDNMTARKLTYECWKGRQSDSADAFFMDGRLTMEMFEILSVQGGNAEQMEQYEQHALFSDEEAIELDCTTKQSFFAAAGIASFMTATLCNWLTNRKLNMEIREIPFYQRIHFPLFHNKKMENYVERISPVQ